MWMTRMKNCGLELFQTRTDMKDTNVIHRYGYPLCYFIPLFLLNKKRIHNTSNCKTHFIASFYIDLTCFSVLEWYVCRFVQNPFQNPGLSMQINNMNKWRRNCKSFCHFWGCLKISNPVMNDLWGANFILLLPFSLPCLVHHITCELSSSARSRFSSLSSLVQIQIKFLIVQVGIVGSRCLKRPMVFGMGCGVTLHPKESHCFHQTLQYYLIC